MANPTDNSTLPKLGQVGELPTGWRKKTPEELAASTPTDSGPLIGGQDSSALGSFVGNVASGFSGVPSAQFEGIDRTLAYLAGVEYSPEKASPIGKLGQGIDKLVASVAAPDPNRSGSIASELGQGIGSTAGYALPFAALGRVSQITQAAIAAGLGAASTGVEQAKDYENARKTAGLPIDKNDQAASFFYGLLPGTLEAVPLARMFGRLDNLAKGGLSAAVKNTAKGTAEEALQEGLQSVSANLIASNVVKYDPDRNLFLDTPESAAVGGGVGFLLNSVMSAVGLRQRAGRYEQISQLNKEAQQGRQQADEEVAKINPATQQPIVTPEIAKANLQMQRLQDFIDQNPIRAEEMQSRIDAIKKQLEDKYITPKKDAEGKNIEVDQIAAQEAADIISGKSNVIEEITAAPAPISQEDFPARKAEPFPKQSGTRVGSIKNEKAVKKFFNDLKDTYGDQITIDQIPEEQLPPITEYDVQEINAAIQEIKLDTTPDIPATETFYSDRPANTALADALRSISEQTKRRDETDAAFNARKEAEINAAYKQRELQLAEETNAPTQEVQTTPQTTIEPTTAPTQEQTKETIQQPKKESSLVPDNGIVTKKGTGFKSEAIAKAMMKRQKIDGSVVEYAPNEFAIVPKETPNGVQEQGQTPTEEIIKQATSAVKRQAYPGPAEDVAVPEGPSTALLRQAGFGDELPPITPTIMKDGIPESLSNREGIPLANGVQPTENKSDAKQNKETTAVHGNVLNTQGQKEITGQVSAAETSTGIQETGQEQVVVPEGHKGKADGTPFATEKSAKAARTRMGLTDTSEVVSVPGGYAIKPPQSAIDKMSAVQKTKSEQTAPSMIFKNETEEVKPELIVTEAPEPIVMEQALYDDILRLSNSMATDARPGRFAPILKEVFGSVQEFMKLRAMIKDGSIIPGNPEEVQETPVGPVENTTITNPVEPPKVEVNTSTQLEGEINQLENELFDIDEEIVKLEDELSFAENPASIEKQIEILNIKRNKLENQKKKTVSKHTKAKKSELEFESQKLTKEEEDELVKLQNESISMEDLDYDEMVDEDGNRLLARPAEVLRAKDVVNKFTANLNPAFKDQIEIHAVASANDIPAEYQILRKRYESQSSETMGRGVIYRNIGDNKKSVVFIFAKPNMSHQQYEWTLFHEVVGHFGIRKLFGDKWNSLMDRFLENKDLASKAFALTKQWTNIDLTPESAADTMYVENKYDYFSLMVDPKKRFISKAGKTQHIRVSKIAMRKLLDEYVAELAGNLSTGNINEFHHADKGIIKKVIAWLRHLLRKSGFGRVSPQITDNVLTGLVKASYSNLTRYPVMVNNNITDVALEASEMVDTVIKEGAANGLFDEKQARALIRSIDSREGRIDNSEHQKRVEGWTDRIRRSWLGKSFSSVGHLPHPSKLNAIENPAKGFMEKATRDARLWFHKTKNLNDANKKAIFNYFTNADADINDVPESVRKSAFNAKKNIEELGEMLVKIGVLNRETYEKNKGSYLPIRYWKYLETYYSSGKQLSFRNYLKQREDLSAEEKQALGQVQDPSLLVSETIATLGRDVALYTMFENMITMDRVGNLGWFIGNPKWITVGDKKMSLSDVDNNIERLQEQLNMGKGVNPLYLNDAGITEINKQIEILKAAKESAEVEAKRQDAIVAIQAAIGPDAEITEDMIKQYQGKFVRVTDPRYGRLMNKYLRKEIYEELIEGGQMYNKQHTDFLSKHLGQGGTADIANQYWKAGKVVMNPTSWVRNGVGNFVLLDIGTNTNSIKLMKMGIEELKELGRGKMTKYVQWAHEYGLFNTTYSAAELSLIQKQAVDSFRGSTPIFDSTASKIPAAFKKMWWLFDKGFHYSLEKSTNFYGGMEGFFKTIALKDHILQWEKINNKSIDSVGENERNAVIRAGVEIANKNIFDYSKVPKWIRSMRRMPFIGAPFLTYTFKAIPQSIESLARRPQKFIKYAMFPTVMAQMFMTMNDLDDKDVEEIRRSMPKWIKEKSSVFLWPVKDANGKWQAVDFGYYLPWAQLHNTYLMATNTFDVNNPALSTAQIPLNTLTDLGFLGGPIIAMISATLTNKDPFTGGEIVRTSGTSEDKINDLMTYMIDLWMPTFITSKGVLGRTLDNMGLEPSPFNSGRELSSLGIDRDTATQVALRGAGVNVYGIDPNESKVQNYKAYTFEKRKLAEARTKIIKDRNLGLESKSNKLRDINEQIKMLNKKHREELSGG